MLIIQIETTEVQARLENVKNAFYDAVNSVEPVFGAYMPYSYYAEFGNGLYGPQPAVVPAIERNANYIAQGVLDRLMPALDIAARTGAIKALKAKVEKIWEDVLNGRPAQDARAMARYRTGAHSGSIAGYSTDTKMERAIVKASRIDQALPRMKRGRR